MYQSKNSSKITWRHAKVMEQAISEARLTDREQSFVVELCFAICGFRRAL